MPPGLQPKDVKVIVYPRKVTIWSQRVTESEENGVRIQQLEEFKRVVPLPKEINSKPDFITFQNNELRILIGIKEDPFKGSKIT